MARVLFSIETLKVLSNENISFKIQHITNIVRLTDINTMYTTYTSKINTTMV